MTLWKSPGREGVIGCLAPELKRRREEPHKRWHGVGRSVREPPSPPAGQAGRSARGQRLRGSGENAPETGVGECCAPTQHRGESSTGGSHRKLTWTSPTHSSLQCTSCTPDGHPEEQRQLDLSQSPAVL